MGPILCDFRNGNYTTWLCRYSLHFCLLCNYCKLCVKKNHTFLTYFQYFFACYFEYFNWTCFKLLLQNVVSSDFIILIYELILNSSRHWLENKVISHQNHVNADWILIYPNNDPFCSFVRALYNFLYFKMLQNSDVTLKSYHTYI